MRCIHCLHTIERSDLSPTGYQHYGEKDTIYCGNGMDAATPGDDMMKIENSDAPHRMVNVEGDAFFPDNIDDAMYFSNEHGAWFVSPVEAAKFLGVKLTDIPHKTTGSTEKTEAGGKATTVLRVEMVEGHKLQDGDKVLLKFPERTPTSELHRALNHLKKVMPGVTFAILSGDIEVMVLTADGQKVRSTGDNV